MNQEVIELIRDTVPIAALVEEHGISLRRSGASLTGKCCFCEGRSRSLKVRPDKGAWFCHRCKAGGDAFTFMMLLNKITFPESVRILAERAGISVDAPLSTETRERIARERAQHRAKLRRERFICRRQDEIDDEFRSLGRLMTAAEDYLRPRLFDQPPQGFPENLKIELSWQMIAFYRESEWKFYGRDGLFHGTDLSNDFEDPPAYDLARLSREFDEREGIAHAAA